MAGIIRWRNLQNIETTESEINLLAGLQAAAADLNRIIDFTGNGSDLNYAVAAAADLDSHKTTDLASSHPIIPNTLDGNIIGIETMPLNRINNYADILTQSDIADFNQDVTIIQQGLDTANAEIANLYTIVFGIGDDGLPQVINNLISHIEQTSNAHDASAISLGNFYSLSVNTLSNSNQLQVSTKDIRWFKIGDEISATDDVSVYYDRTITDINYNTGHIVLDAPIPDSLSTSNNAIVFNRSQGDVQTGIERSLRNTTDVFTGRLSINQTTSNNALEINNTGTGYLLKVNDFSAQSDADWEIELGNNNTTSLFSILNSDRRLAFSVKDDGSTYLNNITFEERTNGDTGLLDHQVLSANRYWTIPDRSGYVGLGDLTFTELLKVTMQPGTKVLDIAPAYALNYDGEVVHAWTTMEQASRFAGGSLDIQAQYSADNNLLTLGSDWQVVNLFITDQDTLGFMYGPAEATRQDAIDNFINIVPSAYMKLAQFIVQGDGVGGIEASSIQILSDQRPIFSMGVSSAFYDESIVYPTGLNAGTVITIPRNYQAGGIRQVYKPGKAQLEVYLDGVYQKVDIDYQEVVGEPEGQIRFLKDLQADSKVRFRITYTSAAAGGGIQAATLQSAYQSGPAVNVSQIFGPIEITSFDTDEPFIVHADFRIDGSLYGVDAYELRPSITEPGNTDVSKIYLDQNQDLILKRYSISGSTYYNITAEIISAQQAVSKSFINATASIIPAGRAVALHPSLTNHIVLCDASSEIPESNCIGVTAEAIGVGQTGKVTFKGIVTGMTGFSQATVAVVDPAQPGHIIAESARVDTATSQNITVGIINGSELIVDVNKVSTDLKIIKVKIAGEAFDANVPKVVRLGKGNTETIGAVYKASKALANLNRNFWAYGLVCPKTAVAAGQSIEVYMESEALDIPLSAGIAFTNLEIGHPFYLTEDGDFDHYDSIAYNSADAIMKVGMIEGARRITLKGIQMMGTKP